MEREKSARDGAEHLQFLIFAGEKNDGIVIGLVRMSVLYCVSYLHALASYYLTTYNCITIGHAIWFQMRFNGPHPFTN